jgi:DNA-directed RNA polymerase
LNSTVDERGEKVFSYYIDHVHAKKNNSRHPGYIYKRQSFVKLTNSAYHTLERLMPAIRPRLLPMVIEPKPWNNSEFFGGYHYRIKTPILKHINRQQVDAVKRANIKKIITSLDYLGCIPWKINSSLYYIIKECHEKKLLIGELPQYEDLKIPTFEEYVTSLSEKEKEAIISRKLFESKTVAKAATADAGKEEMKSSSVEGRTPPTDVVVVTKKGKGKKGVAKEEGEPVVAEGIEKEGKSEAKTEPSTTEKPLVPERTEEEKKLHKSYVYYKKQLEKKNSELHSLRCDLNIKLDIAEEFLNDRRIYYPHNMDFRGRVYPIPPNLCHLGADLSRSLLLFAEGRVLGKDGLNWLKIHYCNLFGNNKISFEERIAWTNSRLDDIFESATNPVNGKRLWALAENPFQALATSMEIYYALHHPSGPENYLCFLPVHQDGSCNGLQHYAGLGRDYDGGVSVNLVNGPLPADVYSRVLDVVKEKIDQDCKIAEDENNEERRRKGQAARYVKPVVNRKVIKQTVMTSVYGVTKIGAREQGSFLPC